MTQRKKKVEKSNEAEAVVQTTPEDVEAQAVPAVTQVVARSALAEERHRLDVLIAAENERIRLATGGSGRALGGLVAKVNASKQRLVELERERADLARKSARICVVKGPAPESGEFFRRLEEDGPVVVLDALQPYIDLAEKVIVVCNPRLDYGMEQHVRLLEALGEWGRTNGVASMPRPAFRERSCRDAQRLILHIRELVEAAFDGEFASIGLAQMLAEDVTRYRFADFVPVVVLNDSQGVVSRNLAKAPRVLEVSPLPDESPDALALRILDTLSSPP